MVTRDHRLLDGTHPKAVRFSVTIFLLFGIFYALIAAAGMLGVPLADGAIATSLLISPLCFLSALFVAARTVYSFQLACLCGFLAVVLPVAVSDLNNWFEKYKERQESNKQFLDFLAGEFAHPASQRQGYILQVVEKARTELGYQEPEELARLDEAYATRIKNWLSSHPNGLRDARATVFKGYPYKELGPENKGGMSESDFTIKMEQFLYVRNSIQYKPWMPEVSKALGKQGMDVTPVSLTPEQQAAAKKHAYDFLSSNSSWAAQQNTRVPNSPEDSEYSYSAVQHSRSLTIAWVISWIVIIGLIGAYAGREEMTNPFSLGELPGQALELIRTLVRRDGTAMIRLGVGVTIILLSIGLAFLLISAGLMGRGLARGVAGLVVLGAMVAASALSFVEVERV